MSNTPTNYILGIRGATTATENTSDAILDATEEKQESKKVSVSKKIQRKRNYL